MVARNRGRYLAPIALIATIAAAVLIVRAGLATKHHNVPVRIVDSRPVSHRPPRHRATFYVIKSGDSLSRISVRTGVSIATLELLNPAIDPYALQTGERLRLRR